MKHHDITNWNRFVKNGLLFDNKETNVKYSFQKMCKMFGKSYLDYLSASYLVKFNMSDDEFLLINGNIPKLFLSKIMEHSNDFSISTNQT